MIEIRRTWDPDREKEGKTLHTSLSSEVVRISEIHKLSLEQRNSSLVYTLKLTLDRSYSSLGDRNPVQGRYQIP